MAPTSERRKQRRYELALDVQVASPGKKPSAQSAQTQTKNISSRGIYFGFLDRVKVGTEVDFEVNLPPELSPGKNVRIRCRGRIVRVEKDDAGRGVGVAATIESYEFVRRT
jgi:hypothetical protein